MVSAYGAGLLSGQGITRTLWRRLYHVSKSVATVTELPALKHPNVDARMNLPPVNVLHSIPIDTGTTLWTSSKA
jgi:hypothetical protein